MLRVFAIMVLLASFIVPSAAQSTTISASAPIGTVTTATLTIDNRNQPAKIAYLYEALTPMPLLPRPTTARRVEIPRFAGKIEPELQSELQHNPTAIHPLIVYLNDQVDLSAAYSIRDWNQRGETVYRLLTEQARRSQPPLLDLLQKHGYHAESLHIVNAILVEGDAQLVTLLAEQTEIASITLDHVIAKEPESATPYAGTANAWGIDNVRAPQVWSDWGVQGAGIVVANIDTGVFVGHATLRDNYRGWNGTTFDNDYNWYDPALFQTGPSDTAGHGTHTMGTMVGRKTATMPAIGVAPQARWIAARGCAGIFCNESDLIKSAQWMLAPTRVGCQTDSTIPCDPRPDLRPHIINNSWGAQGEDTWFQAYTTAWNASGILGIFAAGNNGRQGCRSSNNPGNNIGVFSVGATNINNFIADFSSRGPTTNGEQTPDISAPGVDVPSAWLDGSIYQLSGTSMATPHVAGAAALLWSANPTLIGDLTQTESLLNQQSLARYSTECGDSPTARPNSVYGWGKLDAYASVQAAHVDVAWLSVPPSVNLPANTLVTVPITLDARQVPAPDVYNAQILIVQNNQISAQPVQFTVTANPNASAVQGKIVDYWANNGIYASLAIDNGPTIHTQADGTFRVVLLNGTYNLTLSATGYRSEQVTLTMPNSTSLLFKLVPKIPVIQTTIPPIQADLAFGGRAEFPVTIKNVGIEPLMVSAQVPFQDWSIAKNEPAQWYDLSAFAKLPLTDDLVFTDALDLGFEMPLFGALQHQIYVSSNGWVSTNYQKSASPASYCLPANNIPNQTIAAFWSDLDPSQGGAVRAGQVLSDTFVVSYEAVPLWQNPAITNTLAPTYTFQISFHNDGRVQLNYSAITRMPSRWTVGTQTSATGAQPIGCPTKPYDLSGKVLTLRSQANAQQWLFGSPLPVLLAPNDTMTLTATLRGFGYTPWRTLPAEGVIQLTTNDPRQPIVLIPAQVNVEAPPFKTSLPLMAR